MPNLTLPDARARFRTIVTVLGNEPQPRTIRSGFDELASDETAAQLIALADRELIGQRRTERSSHLRPDDNGTRSA